MDGDADLDTVDRGALERAMQIAQRDPFRAQQLQSKLKDEAWVAVAEFAAYSCQIDALNLKPWESPPCHADEDNSDPQDKAAQHLLRRMLTAGVSRFDPDPLAALRQASRRKRSATKIRNP
jgi:hypothetical protein